MQKRISAAQCARFEDAAARPQPRKSRLLPAFVLLGAALGAVTAAAQTVTRCAWPVVDTNNDGVLDEQELRASREATFERADTDGDGYLTRDESTGARMAGDV